MRIKRSNLLVVLPVVAVMLTGGADAQIGGTPGIASGTSSTSRDQNWADCKDDSIEKLNFDIAACTAIIQSGQEAPTDIADAFYNRSMVHFVKGDFDSAIKDLDQVIRLQPNNAFAVYDRGFAYDKKGQHTRAIQDYDQAGRLNPNLADAFIGRGNEYGNTGRLNRAILDFDKAIQTNPKSALAYNQRGLAYRAKGSLRMFADFSQAIQLDPDFEVAYNNRGVAYDSEGDNDKAIADYNQALRINSNNAITYYNRSMAYAHKGAAYFDLAIADCRKALSIDPSFEIAHNFMEYILKLPKPPAARPIPAAPR